MVKDNVDVEKSFMDTVNKYCNEDKPVALTEPQKELLNKLEYTQLKAPYSISTMRSFCKDLRVATGLIRKGFIKAELNNNGFMEYRPV